MLQIHLTQTLLSRLKSRGWFHKAGYNTSNIRVLTGYGKSIAVVFPINVDPAIDIQQQIEGFFERLKNICITNEITDVYLAGGGTIAIPEFFFDFCRQSQIRIHIANPEDSIDELLSL